MKKLGKKGKEWIKERKILIKEAIAEGRLVKTQEGQLQFRCADCLHWHNLTPDHSTKRSQGGKNVKNNVDWVCNEPPCWCHNKRDNMPDSKKNRKPEWEKSHKCIKCGAITRQIVCHVCKEISIKYQNN